MILLYAATNHRDTANNEGQSGSGSGRSRENSYYSYYRVTKSELEAF